MRIERLVTAPDRAGRYRTEFSDSTVMRLYRQTVEDFGLYTGKELTDEEMQRLTTAAGAMSAKMRAVRIVASTGVSKADLEQRLIHKGEDPEQAKAAVEWMAGLELLDDRKTAEQIVSRCISKGYGLARAKQALYEKRIPKSLWQEVLANYPDQEEEICAFLRSRLTENAGPKEIQRAIDALLRRGHSYGHIRRALEQLLMDTDSILED